MIIESRTLSKQYEIEENLDSLTLSLFDYFEGSNMSYSLGQNEDSYIQQFKHKFSEDAVFKHIIDFASTSHRIKQTLLFKDTYLILIYELYNGFEVYKIQQNSEIKKIQKLYSMMKIFNVDRVNYIKLIEFEDYEYPLIVIQCMNNSDYIRSAYNIRIYSANFDEEEELNVFLVNSISYDRILNDIHLLRSPVEENTFYILGISSNSLVYDTNILQIKMNCTTSISIGSKAQNTNFNSFKSNIDSCVNVDTTIFSSSVLKIDQFIVNSILVISNKTIFVASVNNYGLMFLDMISKSVVDSISFNKLIPNFPNEFIITKLIKIHNNGMRVLIENYGAFSIFWKGIGKVQINEKVFIGMKLTDFLFANPGEVSTTMIDNKENGFSQIVYSGLNEFDLRDAYIHIYSFFSHENSKKFKEIRIGRVNS